MPLFSADATMFFNIYIFFLPTKSWTNHHQKLLRNTQIFFTHSCSNGPNSMFQNVAYRPTVYRTGTFILKYVTKLVKTNYFPFQIFLHDYNTPYLLYYLFITKHSGSPTIALFLYKAKTTSYKPQTDLEQTSNKPWTNLQQTMNKPPTNLQQTLNKPYKGALNTIIFSTRCSLSPISQNTPSWTATLHVARAQKVSVLF